MAPRRRRAAPWWSAPPRGKAWGSLERLTGGSSYFWHEICRGAGGGALARRVQPETSPQITTTKVRESQGADAAEHLMVGDLVDPRYLAQYLIDADVALVRAEYLWQLQEEGRSLPRRQEAERLRFHQGDRSVGCLVSAEELRCWAQGTQAATIFAVSHCWESREHPDPCGYQLGWICDYTRRHHQAFDRELWIFYDYISLCQYQRTAQQDSAFRRAMRQMHLLYAHSSTCTLRVEGLTPAAQLAQCRAAGREIRVYDEATGGLRLVPLAKLRFEEEEKDAGCLHGNGTPYRQRGWCEAEAQWSTMRGRSQSSLRIDVAHHGARSYEVKAPLVPELFRHRVLAATSGDASALKFTWRSDVAQVLRLQEEVFRVKAKSCEELLQKGLPDEEFIHLAVALRCFGQLKLLHLRKCQIRQAGASALCKGLQTLSAKRIKIICSDIDGLKFLVKALAEALRSPAAAIGSLDLSGLSFSQREAEKLRDAEVKELAEALHDNETLEELNLASNDIGREGVKALAAALPRCALLDLNLEGNRMGPEGAQALVQALKISKVTRIGCAGNWLGDEQVEALMKAIQPNRGLSNGLDVDGKAWTNGHQTVQGLGGGASKAWQDGSLLSLKVKPNIQAMSESLRMNGTSTQLQLKWAIGDTAAQALAASLAVNRTVTHIDWAGNRIGDAGAQALAHALQLNRSVVFMDLSGNRIGDLGAQALAEALQENQCLRQIDLQQNRMSHVGRQALLRVPALQPGLGPRVLL